MCPAAWHVDHVKKDDDVKLRAVMNRREAVTGDAQTKSGTIRRAVRDLWSREVGDDGDSVPLAG